MGVAAEEGVRIPKSLMSGHNEDMAAVVHHEKHGQPGGEPLGDGGRHFGPGSVEGGPGVPPSLGWIHHPGQLQPLRHLRFPILS